ncbi:hypothetical protein HSX11_06040 [Oxalobacteraceae bacterium]|nr:hypothetical protein [Oxalobacteraceae bacterium]
MPYTLTINHFSFNISAHDLANYCKALDDELQILQNDGRTLNGMLKASRARYRENHRVMETPELPPQYYTMAPITLDYFVRLRPGSDDVVEVVDDSGQVVCSGSVGDAHVSAGPLEIVSLFGSWLRRKIDQVDQQRNANQRCLDEISFLGTAETIVLAEVRV